VRGSTAISRSLNSFIRSPIQRSVGLGSLVVALNALSIDPGRTWKGPWRWFAEELLDCCAGLDEVRGRGLDLDEFACLARCNGAEVKVCRADTSGLEDWQRALALAASGEGIVVAAYDRASLGQTGSGHFSPIGGYHRARDLALVLDVARFKYPPHWVSAKSLWRAMRPVDAATGRSRGWLTLRRGPAMPMALPQHWCCEILAEGQDQHVLCANYQ
jgi:glutathione gamma-glutamylcysteinyltransferase